MKKTILTLLVLVLACQLSAQQQNNNKHKEAVAIGIRVGGTLPNYYYTENDGLNTMPFDSLKRHVRFPMLGSNVPMLGLNVEIPLFNGIMYVAPEVLFSPRGDSRLMYEKAWDETADTTQMREYAYYQAKVNYLEARLPISIAIPVTPNFKPYVFAAPSFGLATMGTIQCDTLRIKTKDNKVISGDTTMFPINVNAGNMALFDYGVTIGAGLRCRFNFTSFSMIVKAEGGYYWGFCDTYSENEHHDQANAVNLNPNTGHQYNITGKRLNQGWEGSITIAIPLDFHSADDCFYWSDVQRKKNRSRGLFGF